MSKVRTYTKEKDVKEHVKKLLTARGWFWWMPPANGFGKPNVDFNALRGGVFIVVETKFGKNKPTVNQRAYMQSILAESGLAFVVSETTISFFEQWLDAFDASVAEVQHAEPGTPTHKAISVDHGSVMLNAMKVLQEPILLT